VTHIGAVVSAGEGRSQAIGLDTSFRPVWEIIWVLKEAYWIQKKWDKEIPGGRRRGFYHIPRERVDF